MLRIFLALTVLLITGCQTTPVKTAGEIKTGSKIDTSINLPVNLPVAIYVDRHKPDKGINFYGSMKEAAKLVSEDFFSKVEYLKSGNNFLITPEAQLLSHRVVHTEPEAKRGDRHGQ
ncbi:MAG: hypothetical protein ABW087_21490, partial [Candidatus Thiodiazotropha sp.]